MVKRFDIKHTSLPMYADVKKFPAKYRYAIIINSLFRFICIKLDDKSMRDKNNSNSFVFVVIRNKNTTSIIILMLYFYYL
jgi:hypothetical protein